MSDLMQRKAACCCGDCSISFSGDPLLNSICHCENCKRRTGSAFGWSAYFPDDRIVGTEGEPALYILDTADPERAKRYFCPACGTTLYWRASVFPAHTGVAAGCFIEGRLDEPSLSVSEDKRLAWLGLPDHWGRMS